jgi:Ala-tRNA(Pro) deacylase
MVPQPIEQYLHDHGVRFHASTHPHRTTAQETAQSAHVSGKRFAKTVVLRLAGGGYALAVLPADQWIDLDAFGASVGALVDLATEEELVPLFPGCEPGAMPPLGGLYGLPVYAHASLARVGRLVANAGTHTDVIEVDWEDYVAAEHPRIIDES